MDRIISITESMQINRLLNNINKIWKSQRTEKAKK